MHRDARPQTYFAGESYAGQYIPYFADAVLKAPSLPAFPLRGIAIGNGWIDPREQYRGYVDFAYLHGLVDKGSAVRPPPPPLFSPPPRAQELTRQATQCRPRRTSSA